MQIYSLNGLRMFEAAARHLNFSACAVELHISQAAVSQQIRRLEDQLGTKLFVREGGRLSLTIAGRELADATAVALFRVNRAIAKITQSDESENLTITTLSSFATKWLVPRLPSFQSSYPEIKLFIHTSECKEDFTTSGIDGAIRLGAREEPGLLFEPLIQDAMCLIACPELAYVIGANIENLYKHMLLIDGNVSDEYEVFDLTGLATRKSIDALGLDISRLKLEKHKNSTTVVLSALAGKGVGLTRFSLCVDDLQAGRLETLFEFHYPANMQYSLVYPERKLGCRKLAVFKGWLRQELAKSPIIRNVS